MIRHVVVSLSVWCCLSATVPADEAVTFHAARAVETKLEQEELLAVPLDAELFAATRDGYPDLRIVGADGVPVPYVVRRKPAPKSSEPIVKTWTQQPTSAKPLDGGGLEIVVRLDEKESRPFGVRLVSPLKDFEQRVRVYSSTDEIAWEPLGEETTVFDYSRYLDVRNDLVTFPETAHRHFRIVIDDVTVEQENELLAMTRRLRGGAEVERVEKTAIERRPFRIERLEFRRHAVQEKAAGDATTDYPLAGFRVDRDADKRQTVVTLEARREPLTSLTLQTDDRNFSRRATVEVAVGEKSSEGWRPLTTTTVSRVDFKHLRRSETTIRIPETRSRKMRIVLDDRDSPPLAVTGVAASGPAYEAVFLAAPQTGYRLLYDSPTAAPPSYDTAALQEFLRSGIAAKSGALGPTVRETIVEPAAPIRPFDWLNDRRLLGGVAALLVVALGWGLLRAMKRIDALPPAG